MASSAHNTGNIERIELQTAEIDSHQAEQHGHEFSLPPADRGRAAWSFLFTCFFIEAIVWGFPFSYGILQEYYSTHEPFMSKPSGIAAIGSSALGVMYMIAPFHFMYLQRWPNHRRNSCYVGVTIMTIGLITSSFSQVVWHLILTQGILYAIGGALIYNPMLLFLDEWFVQRKGMAFGVMWAGTGASGIFIPFFISWALKRFGYRTLLRGWGAASAILLGPMLMFFAKPRLPVTMSSTEASRRRFDYRFVLSPAFLALQTGNVLQGLGYFIPGIYLPSYANSMDLSGTATTATIVLLNTMCVIGSISVGFLIDRLHVTTVLLIFAVGSALSVFLLWGMSTSLPLLLTFSAAYGFFAAPYTTTYTGVVREIRKQVPAAETGLIMGLLSAGRGIGSVVSGPLSEALLQHGNKAPGLQTGYASGYEKLIIFTGVSVALGGFGFGARRLGWL